MYSARLVVQFYLNPRFLSNMTSCDAASTVHQSLQSAELLDLLGDLDAL
jgi:hypothetical protein